MRSGMAEASITSFAVTKLGDDLKLHFFYRHENHLRDAFAWIDFISRRTAIPARDKYLALVIRIDESSQISEHQAVLVPQPGSREQHRRNRRVRNMNCQTCRHQLCLPGIHGDGLVNTSSHIQPGGAIGHVMWQWDGITES